jgi:hypothetical protein
VVGIKKSAIEVISIFDQLFDRLKKRVASVIKEAGSKVEETNPNISY